MDFSEISTYALDHAAALARWYEARLTLVHVFASLPSLDLPPSILEDAERDRLMGQMRRMAARVPPQVPLDVRVEQAERVHDEILAQLAATHADLLVLGTHGRSGFQRLFLGSVTEKVIRKAMCPTFVVPPRAHGVAPDGQWAPFEVAHYHADVIVMGVHGRGAIDRLVFGSTTHHVIRAAPCPVLIVAAD